MTQIKPHGEIDAAAKLIADWRSMMIVHVVYEHGPMRYSDIADMLELSPTVLSGKLAQLTELGIITRKQADGAKEVTYRASAISKDMVAAYHHLETVNELLKTGVA